MDTYYVSHSVNPEVRIKFTAEPSVTLGYGQSAIRDAEVVLEARGIRPPELEWIKIYDNPDGYVLWTKEYETQGGEAVAHAPLENEIRGECAELADFLVEKNRAYGNSAAEPINIFAKRLDKLAQIDTRIDDKLNRLMQGNEYPGDDTVKDLIGYLILRRIVARMEGGE